MSSSNPLGDDRFGAMFESSAFEVDPESEEYARAHPTSLIANKMVSYFYVVAEKRKSGKKVAGLEYWKHVCVVFLCFSSCSTMSNVECLTVFGCM